MGCMREEVQSNRNHITTQPIIELRVCWVIEGHTVAPELQRVTLMVTDEEVKWHSAKGWASLARDYLRQVTTHYPRR